MHDVESETSTNRPSGINDCWMKIGIRGDCSCPKLEQYAHCRNCPVFSTAAVSLLDRDVPAGYADEWTGYVSFKQSEGKAGAWNSTMIFRIGAEWFALPALLLDEVAEQRKIHSLPHRRSGIVLGLVNVRGELLICVSLGKVLGLEEQVSTNTDSDSTGQKRLVVIRHDGGRMAFPVDEIHSIHRFQSGDLKSVPVTLRKAAAAYTKAILPWHDKTVGCLDDQLIIRTLNRSVA